MNALIDFIIVAIIIIGGYRGFKYGGISAAVNLVGTIFVFVAAFYLKNPIAVLMYENLQFYKFGGMFNGISSLNILFYEAVAFVIAMIIFIVIIALIVKLTHLLDKIINMTMILALPSKLLGLVLGALQYYVVVYFVLFILLQIPFTGKYITESTVVHGIVDKTPLLSNVTNELYTTYNEVYDVCKKNDNKQDREQADYEALDVLMKHEIVTPKSVKKLKEKKKINITNVDELIQKYEKKSK